MSVPMQCQQTIIKASAGSGKTFQLSSVFIALLLKGEAPERILASTFTKKAAAEIRQRVCERLADAVLKKDSLKFLESVLGFEVSQASVAHALTSFVDSQHRLQIVTLDNFCIQLARAFELDVGLLPYWSIRSEQEAREELLANIQRLLLHKHQELAKILRAAARGRLVVPLFDLTEKLLHKLRLEFEACAPTAQEASAKYFEEAQKDLPTLERVKDALNALPIPQNKGGELNKVWSKAVTKLKETVSTQDKTLSYAKALDLAKETILQNAFANTAFSSKTFSPEQLQCIQPLINLVRGSLAEGLSSVTKAYESLTASYFEMNKSAVQSALTFTEIKKTLQRLSQEQDLSSLYYRMDTQLRHILLDEFQDTSLVEWQVLEPLCDEVVSQANGDRSFLCVGDTKQAIYGWRGGVAEIFTSLTDRYPQLRDSVQQLTVSRRSCQAVISSVNQVFSHLSECPCLKPYETAALIWQEQFQQHSASNQTDQGYVAVLGVTVESSAREYDASDDAAASSELIEDSKTKDLRAKLEKIVSRLKEQALVKNLSVALLFRSNGTLEKAYSLLQELAPELELSGEGGVPLSRVPFTATLLALLNWLDHPESYAHWLLCAKSPLSKVLGMSLNQTNSEKMLTHQKLRAELVTLGIASALQRWSSPCFASVSSREQKACLRLLELARQAEGSSERIRVLVERWRYEPVDEQNKNAVRLLTMHKSKGLEFDVVYLADLDWTWIEHSGRPYLLGERSSPLAAYSRYTAWPNKDVCLFFPEFLRWSKQYEQEQIVQQLNVMYVALTRARLATIAVVGLRDGAVKPAMVAALLSDTLGVSQQLPEDTLRTRPDLKKTQSPNKEVLQLSAQSESLTPALKKYLPRTTPSTLVKEKSKLSTVLLPQEALQYGQRVHAFLAGISWHDTAQTDLRNQVEVLQREMPPEECDRIHLQVQKYLQRPEFVKLITLDSTCSELWKERRFAVLDNGSVLMGVFDRVHIRRNAAGAITWAKIIDFKTDRFSPEAVELYKPQLQAYQRALSLLSGLEPSSIEVGLFFLSDDRYIGLL